MLRSSYIITFLNYSRSNEAKYVYPKDTNSLPDLSLSSITINFLICKSIKWSIDTGTPNLYQYRIFFNDIASFHRYQMTSLHRIEVLLVIGLSGIVDHIWMSQKVRLQREITETRINIYFCLWWRLTLRRVLGIYRLFQKCHYPLVELNC
jgi:hypothetical protein